MTTQEIRSAIETKLAEAGIPLGTVNYNDSTCLVAVEVQRAWADAECFVGVWESYVQRWQRDTPYNFTRGFAVGPRIHYSTPEEMVSAVRQLTGVEKAPCWK